LLEVPFPQAAREFAERTIAQAREVYGRSNKTLEAAVQTLEKSFDAAGRGAAALRRNIFDIAQKNLNLSFDLAKSLAGARNLSEIVGLQVAYWRKQFDAFTTQADEVRDRPFDLGAARPERAKPSPKSIRHEPAKKAPPRAQAAPTKKHSPAAREPAAGQRRDTQKLGAPPAAGPTVRPPETQLGTLKKGAPGDEHNRLQRPQRALLPRKKGSKNPKRDRRWVWSPR
jgi:Phasin protein